MILSSQLQAAISVAVDNNNVFATNLVTDNSGNTLAMGEAVVAIGHFSGISDGAITDFSSFTQVGNSVVNFSTTTEGFFDGTIDIDLSTGGDDEAAVGRDVYLVIGDNTASIEQSANWLVFKYNATYAAPPSEGPSTVNLIEGQGVLVQGEIGRYSFDNGGGQTSAFNLVAVPEPSSTALLGLGGLALILRRRR